MIDFHSHILPDMDDGSYDEEESLALLKAAYNQGITTIAATPHFYADRTTPAKFLEKRASRAARLGEFIQGISLLPKILLGAEVSYFEGMSSAEELRELRIENTELLLVEMPFCPWSQRMLDEVQQIFNKQGLIPLIAHIDRYLGINGKNPSEAFMGRSVLLQANAESFLNKKTSKALINMIKSNEIAVLGSDCHNSDSRPQNIGPAMDIIEKKAGKEALSRLKFISEKIIQGYPIGDIFNDN